MITFEWDSNWLRTDSVKRVGERHYSNCNIYENRIKMFASV